jgi:outer membrane receptor protein involved in Fe transport
MRKTFLNLALIFFATLFSIHLQAQNTTITGNVQNSITRDNIPAVSVLVKGSQAGSFTDERGNFRLSTSQGLPLTLVISSVGFETKEVLVTSASDAVQVTMNPASTLGTEVVISASRLPERLLESPVSIERMGSQAIRNAAVPNYYDAIANFKGVDLTTSSLTFRTLSTRGFNGSGNLRFNQLVDGIDNQAPGLNFSVGNIVGPTELDVDNVELLPGASSALYGSGGMNGTLLMTSKNPFRYQGLSFQIKQGVMHVDQRQRKISPYYDWGVRWAKTIGEKFAFKVSGQFMQAKDWQADDTRNLARNNVFSSIKAGDRQNDPAYDGVNVFGDEASASMQSLAQAAVVPNMPTIIGGLTAAYGRAPTQAEITGAFANPSSVPNNPPPQLLGALNQLRPFYLGMQNNVFGSQNVSRTGYNEDQLVDYNTYNLKLNGGLYYKITPTIEASLVGYFGTGTTVYTGADRYSIKNLKMGQYKAEVRANNWFLRAYTVQENSGDSYTATTSALYINNAWRTNANWFPLYTGTYAGARLMGAPNDQAHAIARAAADNGRYLPGSDQFKQAFERAVNIPITEGGAKFDDATDMYHYEGQVNLSEHVKVVDVLAGASFRRYSLNSNGTIFADTTGRIGINEFGSYIQLQKRLFNDVLKLTVSGRYDKNENFKGRFTPRATALIRIVPDNNLRLSFQTAYRFPSTQDQYINLLTGGVNRLIGGLPQFNTFFKFDVSPAYTAESIAAFRTGGNNPTLLRPAVFTGIKPETMNSFELGYRGLISKKLLIDVYGYYSQYKDFLARVAVGRGQSASTNPVTSYTELASPFTTNNYSFITNSSSTVKAIGWGLSAEYQFAGTYSFNVNVSSDELNDVPPGLITFFNTPKYRFNLGLGNPNVSRGIGFNVMYRWQDEVIWEGTFGTGPVDAYGTVDAQISYRFPKTTNMLKIGASNLLNNYYRSAFGNPSVGGLYYVSFGYNVF